MFTDISQYMPHGMCLLWEPWLLILWAGSDLLIVGAYFAIPIALLSVLAKRKDIKQRKLVVLFASFILLCGITHALSILTLWVPVYPLAGLAKLATGLVSVTTAVVLFRLVPALVSLPSLRDMEIANDKLRAEVAAHEETLTILRQAREELEAKVEERTAELREVNTRLSVTAREAVHRSHNLIAVITAMARQSARAHTDVTEYVDTLTGRLTALANATASVIQRGETTSVNLRDVVERQLEPVLQTYPDRIRIEIEPLDIDSEAAKHISLAVHELATNMHKHGSLSGEVTPVVLEQGVYRSAEGKEWMKLTWRETLPASARAEEAKATTGGFGTRLLTQIIPSMLGGTASREFTDGQLVYELDIPLSEIRPDGVRHASEGFVANILDKNFSAA